MLASIRLLTAVALIASASGCNRRASTQGPVAPHETIVETSSTHASRVLPAGTTCAGRVDCPSDQVCVEHLCRYRETSVAGEIFASAASSAVETGDWEGAIQAYDLALERFAEHAPAAVICESAALILRTATDTEGRERGAARADLCFRSTLPGSPERQNVTRALARLRYEGLDPALFDRPEPAARFFTREASQPTLDALEIQVQFAAGTEPGGEQIHEQLTSEAIHRAIAECFVQDWEMHHERTAEASLTLRYSTRLRDMGSYDTYPGTLEIERTSVANEGFETCLSEALPALMEAPRGARQLQWDLPLEVRASIE